MAGAFVAQAEGSAAATGTSIATSGSLTVAIGDALLALVTYDAGDTTPAINTTFGTFTEDVAVQKVSQSPRMRVYSLIATASGTSALTATFNGGADSRTNRAISVIQSSGCAAYLGGTFPAYFNPGSGNDLVTPGNFNVTAQPNYLMSFAWDQAGGGVSPPNGTTSVFTSRGTAWLFADATANMRISDFRATTNGNVTSKFNSGFAGHSYATGVFAWSEPSTATSSGPNPKTIWIMP